MVGARSWIVWFLVAPSATTSWTFIALTQALAGLLGAARLGGPDLGPEIIEGHVELPVMKVRLGLRRRVPRSMDYLPISLKFLQIIEFLVPQLQGKALVGRDTPFVLVAALVAGAIEIAAAGSPEGGGRQLELAARLKRVDRLHASLAVAACAHDD